MTTKKNWQPSASLQTLKQRSMLLKDIRNFFEQKDYMEVETPIMAQHGVTDVYLQNIKAQFRNQSYYLQTSPEFHMKRLLAAGSGPIFQLSKAFRDDELGKHHNPEFTMLEWYKLDVDHHGLMDEVDAFLQQMLHSNPMQRISYQDAFLQSCKLNPFQTSIEELRECLVLNHLDKTIPEGETDEDQYLFLLMSQVVEPYLAKIESPIGLYDFPPSQAALAQIKNGVGHRFEIYYRGMEIGNGFHELSDANQQLIRFEKDNELRLAKGLNLVELDCYLISALEHGLPSCSGIALGIDRLLMLMLNKPSISDVLAFDLSCA
jgi:elongation factor P--(R)-beta-lysine ligase